MSAPTPTPDHCTMCGGPFHAATGHWESEKRHWRAGCTRGMVRSMIEMTTGRTLTTRLRNPDRSYNGKRLKTLFYKYATQPPTEAPVGFRPQDVQDEPATTDSPNQETAPKR